MSELLEERQLVEEALQCVRVNSAGHWPTVAGFLAAEVERLRAELARRDEQIAAAWDEGEGAGWGRANRKWSDEPDLQRATNPYRGGAS